MVALALFIRITHELKEQELDHIDDLLLFLFARLRTPWLTTVAENVTIFGSLAVVAVVSAIAITALWLARRRSAALQIFVALAGSAIWVQLLKNVIQRARPDELPPLVNASGFSYPSGHALTAAAGYLTLAIVCRRSIQSPALRIAVAVTAVVVVVLVGLSRIYLGVHYPSDVASGVLFGGAWAFLVAAWFADQGSSILRNGVHPG